MTARNTEGKILFSQESTWQEIGLDAERRMRYGAWLIKEIIDLSLPPLATQREQFVIHFPGETTDVNIQAELRYFLGGDQGRLVQSLDRELDFTSP